MFHRQSSTTGNVNRVIAGVLILFLLAGLGLWLGGRALAGGIHAPAATYTVCASGCTYSSIQAAIDGAASGDTLELAGETFTETVTIDKSLTILGTDRDDTIIQAANAPGIATSRVITVVSGVDVTIQHVTIRYGNATGYHVPGAGIYSEGGLHLDYSAVYSNTGQYYGGGLYCNGRDLGLNDVIFSDNTAHTGGGVYLDSSCGWPSLRNTIFVGNSASLKGGGLYDSNAFSRVRLSTFVRNTASYGGGAYVYLSSPILENVDFVENSASNGGGLYVSNLLSNSTINSARFYGNEASNTGGGIRADDSDYELMNAVFSGNTAYAGGGIYNHEDSDPTITNVTIASNFASDKAGGLYSSQQSLSTVTNSIIWGNTATVSNDNVFWNWGGQIWTSFSNLEGCNGSGVTWDTTCGGDLGNNIDADPLFIRSPDSGDGDWITPADNDYGNLHLQPASPAIDTGTNAGCPSTDLDGVARPLGPQCDMGAYEFGGAGICVVGTSADAGYNTVQAAVTGNCEEIHILPGAYPEEDIHLYRSVELLGVGEGSVTIHGDDQDSIFSVSPGITVTMKNLIIMEGRRCIRNQGTLILEDTIIADCSTPFSGGGIYNEGDLELDNVEMWYNSAPDGAAIHCDAGSSATIADSRIFTNFASGKGGGIYAEDATRILIQDSQFIDNHAGTDGAGLYVRDLDECLITDSEIDANVADGSGGGIYAYLAGDPLMIENTLVTNNWSAVEGGGIRAIGNLAMTNNTFSNNVAYVGGGGAYLGWHSLGSSGMITATTFSENHAPLGAGIYTGYRGYQTQIVDSTIISNTAGNSGGGLYIDGAMANPTAGVTITHSIIQGNTATNSGGGIATRDPSPGDIRLEIRTSTIENNSAVTGGGIYNNDTSPSSHDIQFDIKYSTIRDNHSTNGDGGGIYFHTDNANNTLKLNSSTVSDNRATGDGAGAVVDGGIFTSTNSTYSWNSATGSGGGMLIEAGSNTSADLKSLTITRNTADSDRDDVGDGGGLYRQSAAGGVTVTASIVAGNRDRSPTGDKTADCDGDFTTGGFNLIGNNHSCTGWALIDIVGEPGSVEDPMLLPLADNGGPTWTHEPEPSSPAVDGNAWADCPNKDQRGLQRPQGALCDIGAFELGTCAPPAAPALNIARDGQHVQLTWNEDSANREYVVARVTDYILETDLFTTTVQEGAYTDYDAIGDPENNYVWLVRGENACGRRSSRSNKVAEFDYPIYDAANDQAPAGADGTSLHRVIFVIPLTGATVPADTETLAAYIDPNGSVKGGGKWNVQSQSWIRRYVGSPAGTDSFPVYPGDVLGIGVDETAPGSFAFIGDIPANGSIQNNLTREAYNSIIVPLDQSGAFAMDADGLAAAIGGVDRVAVWSPFEQRWYVRHVDTGTGPNFSIQPGMPYAIYANDTAPLVWP